MKKIPLFLILLTLTASPLHLSAMFEGREEKNTKEGPGAVDCTQRNSREAAEEVAKKQAIAAKFSTSADVNSDDDFENEGDSSRVFGDDSLNTAASYKQSDFEIPTNLAEHVDFSPENVSQEVLFAKRAQKHLLTKEGEVKKEFLSSLEKEEIALEAQEDLRVFAKEHEECAAFLKRASNKEVRGTLSEEQKLDARNFLADSKEVTKIAERILALLGNASLSRVTTMNEGRNAVCYMPLHTVDKTFNASGSVFKKDLTLRPLPSIHTNKEVTKMRPVVTSFSIGGYLAHAKRVVTKFNSSSYKLALTGAIVGLGSAIEIAIRYNPQVSTFNRSRHIGLTNDDLTFSRLFLGARAYQTLPIQTPFVSVISKTIFAPVAFEANSGLILRRLSRNPMGIRAFSTSSIEVSKETMEKSALLEEKKKKRLWVRKEADALLRSIYFLQSEYPSEKFRREDWENLNHKLSQKEDEWITLVKETRSETLSSTPLSDAIEKEEKEKWIKEDRAAITELDQDNDMARWIIRMEIEKLTAAFNDAQKNSELAAMEKARVQFEILLQAENEWDKKIATKAKERVQLDQQYQHEAQQAPYDEAQIRARVAKIKDNLKQKDLAVCQLWKFLEQPHDSSKTKKDTTVSTTEGSALNFDDKAEEELFKKANSAMEEVRHLFSEKQESYKDKYLEALRLEEEALLEYARMISDEALKSALESVKKNALSEYTKLWEEKVGKAEKDQLDLWDMYVEEQKQKGDTAASAQSRAKSMKEAHSYSKYIYENIVTYGPSVVRFAGALGEVIMPGAAAVSKATLEAANSQPVQDAVNIGSAAIASGVKKRESESERSAALLANLHITNSYRKFQRADVIVPLTQHAFAIFKEERDRLSDLRSDTSKLYDYIQRERNARELLIEANNATTSANATGPKPSYLDVLKAVNGHIPSLFWDLIKDVKQEEDLTESEIRNTVDRYVLTLKDLPRLETDVLLTPRWDNLYRRISQILPQFKRMIPGALYNGALSQVKQKILLPALQEWALSEFTYLKPASEGITRIELDKLEEAISQRGKAVDAWSKVVDIYKTCSDAVSDTYEDLKHNRRLHLKSGENARREQEFWVLKHKARKLAIEVHRINKDEKVDLDRIQQLVEAYNQVGAKCEEGLREASAAPKELKEWWQRQDDKNKKIRVGLIEECIDLVKTQLAKISKITETRQAANKPADLDEDRRKISNIISLLDILKLACDDLDDSLRSKIESYRYRAVDLGKKLKAKKKEGVLLKKDRKNTEDVEGEVQANKRSQSATDSSKTAYDSKAQIMDSSLASSVNTGVRTKPSQFGSDVLIKEPSFQPSDQWISLEQTSDFEKHDIIDHKKIEQELSPLIAEIKEPSFQLSDQWISLEQTSEFEKHDIIDHKKIEQELSPLIAEAQKLERKALSYQNIFTQWFFGLEAEEIKQERNNAAIAAWRRVEEACRKHIETDPNSDKVPSWESHATAAREHLTRLTSLQKTQP